MLNTLNEKFIGFVWILLSFTSYLSIPICVYPESTSTFTLSLLLFFVFTSACMFNSLYFSLFLQFGIIYFSWEFTWKISYTMPTWDHLQNSIPSLCPHYLTLLGLFFSSSTEFLYSLWQYVPLYHIWNIFLFCILSSLISISLSYIYIYCSWSTWAFYPWSCHWIFLCSWAVHALYMLFQYLSYNYFVLLWTYILILLTL